MKTNETIELTDLQPIEEVKGGIVALEYLIIMVPPSQPAPPTRPPGGMGFVNNHNETVASDEALLADLEPREEVIGGTGVQAGFGYAALTVGGAANLNRVTEHTSNLTYSGESGGI